MNRSPLFLDDVNQRQGLFARRSILFGGLAGAGLLALGGRLAQLQLVEAGKYAVLSEHNEFDFVLTPPPRGLILDRHGVVLASNRPDFRLLLARDETIDVDAVLANLARLFPIDEARLRRLRAEIETAPRKVPVAVVEDMTWEQFSSVNVRAPELPGVTADMGEVRVYPFSAAFAHVVGYVAKVSARDITKTGPNAEPILLNPGFRIGKQGIEKSFDLDLRGKPGARKVEVDVKGRVVRQDPQGDIPAVPGAPISLTLDADIQNRAMEVFGEDSGAAVMMDCRNGDILCLFSAPSFDANGFVKGMSGPDYRALTEYERKPLFNKALTATYPPGSTFKTMVTLAALDKGVPPSRTYTCNKHWFWGGRSWGCDEAHGTNDLEHALAKSCDIYFYQLALSIGPDCIATVARRFGLGQAHEIGIPGQKSGLVPDRAYKRRNFPRDPVWHPGETPSMGIGQGYTTVTALQLCVQASRLANGKVALDPRLVQSIGGEPQPSGGNAPELGIDPEHLGLVRRAMLGAVTYGTADHHEADLGLGPIVMAGKTGTAQMHNYAAGTRGQHGARGAWETRDHAWFIAFAPYDDPRYAMSVLVEHGGMGASAAAPKAAQIMKVALLKDPQVRARIVQPPPVPKSPAPDPDAVAPPGDLGTAPAQAAPVTPT
jgi:penicillin-binding protein 2